MQIATAMVVINAPEKIGNRGKVDCLPLAMGVVAKKQKKDGTQKEDGKEGQVFKRLLFDLFEDSHQKIVPCRLNNNKRRMMAKKLTWPASEPERRRVPRLRVR